MKNWIGNVSNILSKRCVIFTKNFAVFFFSNAGITGNLPEFEFDEFWRTIFWKWYKCNICIVTTSALDWKQLTIFYKFYPIKQIYLSERISYLAHTCHCSNQNSYTLLSLCVMYFSGNKYLKGFVKCWK